MNIVILQNWGISQPNGTISLFDEEEKKPAPLRNYQYNVTHHLVLLKSALLFSSRERTLSLKLFKIIPVYDFQLFNAICGILSLRFQTWIQIQGCRYKSNTFWKYLIRNRIGTVHDAHQCCGSWIFIQDP
jgi:hypothetical protein